MLKKQSSKGKEKEILDQIKELKPHSGSDRSGKKDAHLSKWKSCVMSDRGSEQNSEQRSMQPVSMKQEFKKLQSSSNSKSA